MLGSKRVARVKTRSKVVEAARAEISTKAAAYLRVSTDEQATSGGGLEAQAAKVRAFATSQGYDLVSVFSDPGVSGAIRPSDRPGFSELLALAEQGAFAVVLVARFDRLARSVVFAVTAANDLSERLGVALRSVSEPIDTATPMGRMLFAVLAGMAEQERAVITERTHGGRKEKAGKGGRACGAAPFGYRAAEGGLVIHEPEAQTVRRIFGMRAEAPRPRLVDIANRLNADAVPAPRGGVWRVSTVAYLLDNPAYRGVAEFLFTWGGAEAHVLRKAKHQAIVKAA